jgi:hypothetical protein
MLGSWGHLLVFLAAGQSLSTWAGFWCHSMETTVASPYGHTRTEFANVLFVSLYSYPDVHLQYSLHFNSIAFEFLGTFRKWLQLFCCAYTLYGSIAMHLSCWRIFFYIFKRQTMLQAYSESRTTVQCTRIAIF